MISLEIQQILEKAKNRSPLTKEDCIYMLSQSEYSMESGMIRSMANKLIRDKNENSAIIIGQVGVDIHPCEAKCGFCSFREGHTDVPIMKMEKDVLKKAILDFCKEGDLYGLYLMTMATFDKKYLLDMVSYAREIAPKETQIWVNTGDADVTYYEELKAAGACGAYHVCRLREGTDTNLNPKKRFNSMENIKIAGLDLFSCCEPIGLEHSPLELTDNIFLCLELGVTQFGAMKRIAVPGSPLCRHGQISDLKMAHIMGCAGLVYASVDSARFFGVHEPCELGYVSGANFVTAETGANPRDSVKDTSKGRGWDMSRCRKLLFECGFERLLRGDDSKIALTYDYLKKTDSIC